MYVPIKSGAQDNHHSILKIVRPEHAALFSEGWVSEEPSRIKEWLAVTIQKEHLCVHVHMHVNFSVALSRFTGIKACVLPALTFCALPSQISMKLDGRDILQILPTKHAADRAIHA